MANSVYNIIDSLDVSKEWKTTFTKIHLAYYKNYAQGKAMHPLFWVKASELVDLSLIDSMKISPWFNPWGLILGPIYYLLNGLYKKGIILLLIFTLLMYINNTTRVMGCFVFLYCSIFIDMDYYNKKVLNHPEFLSNPLIVGDDFDKDILASLLKTRINFIPYIIIFLAMLSPFALGVVHVKNNQDSVKDLVSEPQKICNTREECSEIIKQHIKDLASAKDNKQISYQHYIIALTYYSIDDLSNTIKSLDSAIYFDNENINAYLLRAKIYGKLKNNVQALLDYKEALHINPQATFLNYYVGHNYYALTKYERALEYFEKATKTNEVALYFEAQGYTRGILGDNFGAAKDIKKAIALYNQEKNTDKVRKLGEYLKKISK